MECERRATNDERHTYELLVLFLTATAVGVLLEDSDTKVVETSVTTAGILVDEVVMVGLLTEGVVETVEVALETELEVLEELVLEVVVEEEIAVLEDDDEEVEVVAEVVDVSVSGFGGGIIGEGNVNEVDVEVLDEVILD